MSRTRRRCPVATLLVAVTLAPPIVALPGDPEVAAEGLPDLRVADVRWSPSSPSAGGAVSFTAIVENVGNATSSSFTVRFFLNGANHFAELDLDGLRAGQNASVTSNATKSGAGTNTIRVLADARRAVPESNESNNERVETFTASGSLPDLEISSIRVDPARPFENDTVRVTAVVRNRGAADAPPSWVYLAVWGGSYASHWAYVGPLAPGTSAEVGLLVEAGRGWHTVYAHADERRHVTEEDEWNNYASGGFFAQPRPDLAVRIAGIEKPRFRTDVADAPNPVGERRVLVETCNAGRGALNGTAELRVSVHADRALPTAPPSATLDVRAITPLAPLSCRVERVAWDPLGFVGDVTIRAAGRAEHDRNPANDVHEAADFVIVGGIGGVRVV